MNNNKIFSKEELDKLANNKLFHKSLPKANFNFIAIPITYQTITPNGDYDDVSSTLFLPLDTNNKILNTDKPLIVYSKGTDLYRPSRVIDNYKYKEEMIIVLVYYAAQGYPLFISDLLGYGDSKLSYHPYLHAESEAKTTLDGIHAAYKKVDELNYPLKKEIFLMGYSQGGHTACATHKYFQKDKDKHPFKLLAAAYLSAPLNITESLLYKMDSLGSYIFGPLLLIAYKKIYGNEIYYDENDVFISKYAKIIMENNFLLTKEFNFFNPTQLNAGLWMHINGHVPLAIDSEIARNKIIKKEFIEKIISNIENSKMLEATKENTLIDFTPTDKTLICFGSDDKMVDAHLNSIKFIKNNETNKSVTYVDFNEQIINTFLKNSKIPTGKISKLIYYIKYHAFYGMLFSMKESRNFLEKYL